VYTDERRIRGFIPAMRSEKTHLDKLFPSIAEIFPMESEE